MRALSEGGEARANPPSGTRNNKTTMRGLRYQKSQGYHFGVEVEGIVYNFNPECVIELGRAEHALIGYPQEEQVCTPN